MSLEAYIDIRFGDPVLSMSMDFEGLVYGSMTGRLLYHNFASGDERTLKEYTEECIRGVWMGPGHTIFAAVGDLLMLVYGNGPSGSPQTVKYEKEHACDSTQVITFEDQSCLLQLQRPTSQTAPSTQPYVTGLMLKNFSTNLSTELIPLPLPQQCVPMDFDGQRLLTLEYTDTGHRSLHLFDFKTRMKTPVISSLTKSQGHLSFALFSGDKFLFVIERRKIMIRSLTGSEPAKMVGQTRQDIVACSLVGVQTLRPRRPSFSHSRDAADGNLNDARDDVRRHTEELEEMTEKPLYSRLFILTADAQGLLQIWEEGGPVESIRISECRELTPEYQRMDYFSMGYPYVITAFGPRLAVSTDHGVLVFKSKVLEAQQVLNLEI